MRNPQMWIAALLLAQALGCGAAPKKQPATAARTETPRPAESPSARAAEPRREEPPAIVAVPNQPSLVLMDAGAEPRRPLRYRFHQGASEMLVAKMKLRLAMRFADQVSSDFSPPPIDLRVAVTPTEVDSSGTMRVTYRIESAKVTGSKGAASPADAAIARQLATMEGLSGWAQVDARGKTTAGGFDVPATLDPQARQFLQNTTHWMQQQSIPFPEEPVGVGARWKYIAPVQTDAVRLVQTSTYELRSVRGDTAEFAVGVEQHGNPQPMEGLGLPPGFQVRLESLRSTGKGTSMLDLRRIVPSSSIELQTRSEARVGPEGDMKALHTDLELALEVTSEPPRASRSRAKP